MDAAVAAFTLWSSVRYARSGLSAFGDAIVVALSVSSNLSQSAFLRAHFGVMVFLPPPPLLSTSFIGRWSLPTESSTSTCDLATSASLTAMISGLVVSPVLSSIRVNCSFSLETTKSLNRSHSSRRSPAASSITLHSPCAFTSPTSTCVFAGTTFSHSTPALDASGGMYTTVMTVTSLVLCFGMKRQHAASNTSSGDVGIGFLISIGSTSKRSVLTYMRTPPLPPFFRSSRTTHV